jgi:long-chain acyl-CoA synthetase
LTSREFLDTVLSARKNAPTLQHLFLKEEGGPFPAFDRLREKGDAPETGVGPDSLSLLMYTAGTTGSPKGVMLTHANLLANLESCRRVMDVGPRDRFLCLLPMFHAFSWTVNVLLPLRLGASVVVMEAPTPFEPVLKAIWDHKVTVFCGVPPLFAALTQKIRGIRAWVLRFLNPVRVAVSGAAALPPKVLRDFERKFHIPLLEGYGLTEASPVVAVQPLHRSRKAGTVGPPLPGVEVKIIDEEERPLPKDTVGEICVRGANVMAGYFKRTEETRETFTRDGWLKTGDLGRLDAGGRLSVVDRKKDLIIVKGLNVYPLEIETVLLSQPDVAEAAVIGVPDDTGDEVINAFVVPKPGKTVSPEALLLACRQALAPFKVPREIHGWDVLPKNTLGKVLKKDLRETLAARRGGAR